jgi:predicted transcriptional regulator
MAVGLVNDDEFFKELTSYKKVPLPTVEKNIPVPDFTPVLEGTIEQVPSRGRSKGDNNVPSSLRAIIGEEALLNGRQSALDLARDFGISPSSVSAYSKGATSTASYNEPKSSIVSVVNKARERAAKKAAKTLNQALATITQEKLDFTDAKDLAGIARDMSVLIKNLEPQSASDSSEAKSPQFVIFAPQFRDERSFETIQVIE